MAGLSDLRTWKRALAAVAVAAATLVAAPAAAQTTVTIGDGANPGNPVQPLCPRDNGTLPTAPGAAVNVNAFSLVGTAAATVNRVEVRLAPTDAYLNVDRILVRDSNGVTLGSYAPGPIGSGTYPVSLTIPIAVTTSAATYYLAVVPKQHQDMPPAANGTSIAVQAFAARVVIAGAGIVTGTDATSSTVTIDNGSPANVDWAAVVSTTNKIQLDWAGTPDPTVLVLRRAYGPVEDSPADGTASYAIGAFPGGTSVVRYAAQGPYFDDTSVSQGVPYYYRVFTKDACNNYSKGASLGPIYPGSGEGDLTARSTKPVVGIVNPGNGPVTRPFKVQIRVFSPGGTPINEVRLYGNNGAGDVLLGKSTGASPAITKNANYDKGTPDPASGIYEFTATTSSLAATGTWTLRAWAANVTTIPAPPNDLPAGVYSGGVGVIVSTNVGDGKLLVRDNSSQLCSDCHAAKTHSSEATGNDLGSWYVGCRGCHDPHGTTNAKLVAAEITPPSVNGAQAPQKVFFTGAGGVQAGGKAAPDGTGLCQVCHTRTAVFQRGIAVPAGDSHSNGSPCKDCHKHNEGQKASCSSCHGTPGRALVEDADALAAAAPPSGASPAGPNDVGAHQAHVNRGLFRKPLPCSDCHTIPNTHNGAADLLTFLGENGLAAKGGQMPVFNPAASACDTVYCHAGPAGADAFDGNNPAPGWTAGQTMTCQSCHASPPRTQLSDGSMHPDDSGCATCHGFGYDVTGITSAALATHVDGTLQAQNCTGCHGTPGVNAAPPAAANPVTANNVGAHQKHVTGTTFTAAPLDCTACHVAFPAGHNNTSQNVAFSALGTHNGTLLADYKGDTAPATPTCVSVWCHAGARGGSTVEPSWLAVGPIGCNYCHANSPAYPHPTNQACSDCHPSGGGQTYSKSSPTAGTVVKATHIDGTVTKSSSGCTACHGLLSASGVTLVANLKSSAPGFDAGSRDTKGGTTSASNGVGAHDAHLSGTGIRQSGAAACTDCHALPPADSDTAHATGSGPNGSRATVNMLAGFGNTGGTNPTFSGSNSATLDTLAGSCSNTYCHGGKWGANAAYQGTNNQPGWQQSAAQASVCGTCHKAPPSTAAHDSVQAGSTRFCDDCHSGYHCTSSTLSACLPLPAVHMDGTFTAPPMTCTSCHGTLARANNTTLGVVDTNEDAAPPRDAAWLNASNQVGPHQAHVNPSSSAQIMGPIACNECHANASTYTTSHANGTTNVAFTGATYANKRGFSPSPTAGAPYGCSTYCHDNPASAGGSVATGAWKWDTTTATCGSCHGSPPSDARHVSVGTAQPATVCAQCHDATVNGTTGAIVFTGSGAAATTLHINGVANTGTISCQSCHGGVSGNNAPPKAATASANAVGAHQSHVIAGNITNAISCNECHPTVSGMNHADAYVNMAFSTTLSTGTAWRPTQAGGADCSASYCHGGAASQSAWGAAQPTPKWTAFTPGGVYQNCNACHGAVPLLNATTHHPQNNVSDCEACHPAGYRRTGIVGASALNSHLDHNVQADTGCTACHGDLSFVGVAAPSNAAAAPGYAGVGVDSRGSSAVTTRQVGAHDAHVRGTSFRPTALPCNECHFGNVPGALDVAHVNGTVAAPAGGPLATDTSLGTTPSLSWSGTTCANTYCHGNFKNGKNATMTWAQATTLDCNSCHGRGTGATPTPPDGTHLNRTDCATCHPDYTVAANRGTHMDGNLDTPGMTCRSCHGAARSANGGIAGLTDANLIASPPNDINNNASSVQVGPHMAHVNPVAGAQIMLPIKCSECHGVAADSYTMAHSGDGVQVVWTSAVAAKYRTTTPSWTDGSPALVNPGSCVTYCHGDTLADVKKGTVSTGAGWKWDTTTNSACGSCHGMPPDPTGSHQDVGTTAAACNGCHDETVDPAGNIIFTGSGAAATTKHINGVPDGGESMGGQACTGCHNNIYQSMSSGGLHRHAMTSATGPGPAGSPTVGTYTTSTTARTCTQCHVDHNLFVPTINAAGSRAKNLRLSATAAPTAANTQATDHNAGTGVCVSCHATAQTKGAGLPDAGQATPVIDGTAFTASAHDYGASNPTSEFKGTPTPTFAANCAKCHSSEPNNASKQPSAQKFELHASTVSSLTDPLGAPTSAVMEEAVCYRCHSKTSDSLPGTKKGTAGRDYYNAVAMAAGSEDVYTAMQKGTAGTAGGTSTQVWTTLYFKPNAEVAASTTGTLPTGHLSTTDTFAGGTWAARAMTPGPSTGTTENISTTADAGTWNTTTQYWRRLSFISPPAEAATTLAAGNWTLNLWGYSNSAGANFKPRYAVYTIASNGTLKNVIIVRASGATNFGTTAALNAVTAAGASTAIAIGDRIVVDVEAQTLNSSTTARVISYSFGSTASASVTMPTGIRLTATVTATPSSARHDVAKYNGVHKVDPAAETRAYIAGNKHVACADCHSPHAAGKGSPGTGGTTTAAGTTTTLTDGSKNGVWTANQWVGYYVMLVPPTAAARAGQTALITASTAAGGLTFSPAFGTAPASGDTYAIYARTNGGNVSSAAAAGSTSIVDSSKNATWTANMFNGWYVYIQSGAGAGQVRQITATAATGTLTVASGWTTALDTTSVYRIVKTPQDQLTGATGVGVTTWVATATWTNLATNTYNPSTTAAALITNTGAQWQVCFKCHSGANANIESTAAGTGWSAGLAANSTFTDIGREFSPQNGSYHPIVQALPTTDPGTNGSNRLNATQLINGWKPGDLMTCSDCHNNDASAPAAQGPHGSAMRFMLAGVNKAWPYLAAGATSGTLRTLGPSQNVDTGLGTEDGLFCRNCHPNQTTTASTSMHQWFSSSQHSSNGYYTCAGCHIRIPHGGKVSRLILTPNAPARYKTTGAANPILSITKTAYRSYSSGTGWQNVSCNEHANTAGEAW